MAAGNYGRNVRYMVLGPLRVTRDGEELPLGGPQQRLVLALLIQANGRAVSTANLIDGVWGEDEPATAKKTLQGYIHHLRSQVGDVLKTEGAGYSLDTKGAVDVVEFEKLRETGMEAMAADPSNAANLFRNALALWSGPPYADLDGHHAVAPEAARLTDLRIAVLGDRIDADLACGGHNGLIGELEGLTQEYPLQDRFRAQHMLALFRAGRQVEALRSFERTRRFLGEEMGLEPSADLQRLEQQILAGDEELLLGDAGDPSGRSAVRGYELREVVKTGPSRETYRAYQRSVGREVTVEVLGAEIADDPVFIANYLADTQRVAALEHPNIGFVHDTWREPGRAYLVSRWFGGGSLADNLEEGPMRMAEAMGVIDQIGAAVSYAHRHGVAHGALNAGNVMLDDEGNAHLTGFVVGSGLEPDLAGDRRAFAALAYLLLVGRPPRQVADGLEADLLGVDLPSGVGSVFEVAFESSAGYGRVEDFLRGLRQVLGADSVIPTTTAAAVDLNIRNPYKGLRAFQESDADDFYGRAELIDRLVDRLDHNRLVAVVGPSGSGKSSVVKAGLAARVRAREDGVLHLQTEMFPGAFPFEELEGALLRVGVNRDSVIGDLLADERGLLRVLKQILPSDDSELLLVIDQFEELFSMVSERKVAQLFLSSLATAAADPRSRLRVVMTMRADFFDRPLESPEFASLMEAGLVPVSLPDREGLAAAVSQPALSVGLDFEDGLIDRIVRDLDDQPGGLPLLQYAMTELVEQRTGSLLTFAAYEGIGGVYGALGQRAEDLYQSLKPRAQEALRQAFLRMVSVDESAKDLRRRVTQAELLATEVDDQSLNEALQLFGGHRLLTFDLDPVTRARTVEVAHEALTREWDRLSEWIEDQRDDIVIRKRLDAARLEWQQAAEDASYLPSGSRLAQFEEWSRFTTLSLSTDERSFLEAASEREALGSAKAAVRRRRVFVTLVVATALFAILSIFAFVQKRSADESAYQSETGRLRADAVAVSGSNARLGLLLAAEAHEREVSPQTLGSLQQVLTGLGPVLGFFGDGAVEVEWESDRIVTFSRDGVRVFDSETREQLRVIEVETALSTLGNPAWTDDTTDGVPSPFAVSSDGRWSAIADGDGSAVVVDLDTGDTRLVRLASPVTSVEFSNDGAAVAIGEFAGDVTLFDVEELSLIRSFPPIDRSRSFGDFEEFAQWSGEIPDYEEQAFRASAIAFNSDGEYLAIGQGPRVTIWDVSSGERIGGPIPIAFEDFDFPVPAWSLEFYGDTLLTYFWGSLHRADWRTGQPLSMSEIEVPGGGNVAGAAVYKGSGDGNGFALTPTGLLYELEFSNAIDPLEELTTDGLASSSDIAVIISETRPPITKTEGLALSPDGSRWVVAGVDTLLMGSADRAQPLARALPSGSGDQLSISGDGATTGSSSRSTSTLWDLSGPQPVQVEIPDDLLVERQATFPDPDTAQQLETVVIELGDGRWGFRQFTVGEADVYSETSFKSVSIRLPNFGSDGISIVSPDGRLIAYGVCAVDGNYAGLTSVYEGNQTCGYEGVNVADLRSGTVVAKLRPEKILFGLDWSSDSERLLHLDSEGMIITWDAENWVEVESPVNDSVEPVRVARYTPDGKYLITVDDLGVISFRESLTGKVLKTVTGAAGVTNTAGVQMAFTQDSQLMLTGFDGSVRLWDMESGSQIGVPFPHDIGVTPGFAESDTLQLVTAAGDKMLIWNLDVDSWPEIACNAAGRNMTEAEWEQFGPKDTEYRATCPQYPIEE